MTRRTLLALLAASVCSCSPAAAQDASKPVAILGVAVEVKDIEAQLVRPAIERVQGVPFSVGTIGSTRVILGKDQRWQSERGDDGGTGHHALLAVGSLLLRHRRCDRSGAQAS
jgi:hypothetical protein